MRRSTFYITSTHITTMHKEYKHLDIELPVYKLIVENRDKLGLNSISDTIMHFLPQKKHVKIEPKEPPHYQLPIEIPEVIDRINRKPLPPVEEDVLLDPIEENGIDKDEPDRFYIKSAPPVVVVTPKPPVVEPPTVQPLVLPPCPVPYSEPTHGIIRRMK